jgi:hypothetical protein
VLPLSVEIEGDFLTLRSFGKISISNWLSYIGDIFTLRAVGVRSAAISSICGTNVSAL